MTWAQRLKRVFAIDIEKCERCGGPVRIIASIEDPDVIEKILKHLGLDQVGDPQNRSPPSDPDRPTNDAILNSSAQITHIGDGRIRPASGFEGQIIKFFNRWAKIFDHTTHVQMRLTGTAANWLEPGYFLRVGKAWLFFLTTCTSRRGPRFVVLPPCAAFRP